MPVDVKAVERLLNSGVSASHPELAPHLAEAEAALLPLLEAKGLATQLDLTDRPMLRRFLIARNLQVDQTVVKLEAHAEWRRRTLPVQLSPAVVTELRKGKAIVAGTDCTGRPLVTVRSCCFDPKIRDLEASILAFVHQVEGAVKALPDDSAQFAVLYDRTDFSLRKNLDIELVKAVVKTLSDNYPERLGVRPATVESAHAPRKLEVAVAHLRHARDLQAVYVFPTGSVATMVFGIVKVFMNPRTVNKVQMVGSREKLLTLVPEEHLAKISSFEPDSALGQEAVQLD